MKKSFRLIALCLSLLMVFAFAACSSNEGNSGDSSGQGSGDSAKLEKGVTADTIKVAYILPFTGPSAQYGERQKNAMTMVAEKWNNAGGINGRKIEVEYFDDKNEKTETAIVANQIVGRDDIFCCFGPFSSTCALAVVSIFDKAEMPIISATTSHSGFAVSSKWAFSGAMLQTKTQELHAKWLQDQGYTKIASLYLSDDQGIEINDSLTKYVKERGGEVVYSQTYIAGTKDFNPMLTAIKESGAEYVNMVASYGDFALALNQARDIDLMVPFTSTSKVVSDEFVNLISPEDVGEGIYALGNYSEEYATEEGKKIMEEYNSRFPITFESHASMAYDVIDAVFQGIASCGDNPTREGTREWLATKATNLEGLFGPYGLDEDGNIIKDNYLCVFKKEDMKWYTTEKMTL